MSLSTEETSHTNADYRCRIIENKESHFMIKQCSVEKNYGSKKGLHLPRRPIYLKKDEQTKALDVGDYLTVKLKLNNRRTNVESVLNINKVIHVSNKINVPKDEVKNTNGAKHTTHLNRFSALDFSSDEED